MKLNLGCGLKKINGFINVDIIKTSAVDVVHDLNVFPYPFTTSSVEEIIMDNTLEHLDNVIAVVNEMHRLLKPEGILKIKVPYFKSNSAYTDPTHKNFFTEKSFKYFTENNPLNFYSLARFKIIKINLINQRGGLKHFFRNLLPGKKILNYFLFNIYDEVYFELSCLK